MRLTVTARHGDVPEDVKTYAEETLSRMSQKIHRPHDVDIVFDRENGRFVAEIRLHTVKAHVFACSAEAGDFRTALDRAFDKVYNHFDKAPVKKRRTG